MIIDILIFIIAILCLLQEKERRMTAMIFILILAAWAALWPGQPKNGHLYYLSGALFATITINILARLKYVTKLTERLCFVCYMFVIFDIVGWFMWIGGLNTMFYEYACISLFCFAIWSLLTWDGIENGNYREDWSYDIKCSSHSQCPR